MAKNVHKISDSKVKRRSGGRAIEVVSAVHSATIELLQEQGFARLEIPAVAERAGVNKTSIYRRWPSKAELVLDVSLERLRTQVPVPNTGSLKGDMTSLLRTIAYAIHSPLANSLLRALIGLDGDTELSEIREKFWSERNQVSGEILRRAVANGQLPKKTDFRLMMEMAVAPIYFRALITKEPISHIEIKTIADRVIKAFQAG